MNVIFLDFDGVLTTINRHSNIDIENRIKLLGEICTEYDCKVVIEASAKDAIDPETMDTDSPYIKYLLDCFKKYNIDCIGRTPTIRKELDNGFYLPIWKEDEIISYLESHPEIEHFCIIDDDDATPKSDLDKLRSHLVKTIYYSKDPSEEGLLEKHKYEVEKVLQLENSIKPRSR